MDFNDNPEFNDWLDETYPRVEIGEFSEAPSVVLFEMDPSAYLDQLDAWKSQQIEEFPEVVVNEFPAPVAHYLQPDAARLRRRQPPLAVAAHDVGIGDLYPV
ncbi:hypothetical protein BJI67_06535 [Acidihalobacter aeolianus]|uniref:Uncharacterized protein n=1 Tax=Acidihalobacter aeolianus TaxID=2792603 RepID=A0A1D8K726_9GAMM|nr:hypothetical protein [Acidihalobacter aeolianus]AOV16763.1 hypothetical protein BJI67_06535 [Acidihalobacter aeolianus]